MSFEQFHQLFHICYLHFKKRMKVLNSRKKT